MNAVPDETSYLTDSSASPTPSFTDYFDAICDNVSQVINGKESVIELAVLCLIAEGHLLIEDVPGVGKTSLAKAIATSVGGKFTRVQFTPDLLPTDVIGTSVWNQGDGQFEFRPGPVFTNVVLADEINRSPPKTQSALLEAMAESQVTSDGVTRSLDRPFMVIATQNPVDYHGTYPLPESQLDRFLLKVSVGYPGPAEEAQILRAQAAAAPVSLSAVVGPDHIVAMANHARAIHVAPSVTDYIVGIAAMTRHHPSLDLGISPRATLGLQRAVQVRAAAQCRDHVQPDDVKALAIPVLAHRLILTPEARTSGVNAVGVVEEVLATVPIPNGHG